MATERSVLGGATCQQVISLPAGLGNDSIRGSVVPSGHVRPASTRAADIVALSGDFRWVFSRLDMTAAPC